MQCVQRIAQFEKMFETSSHFLEFIEDTLADEQMEDALSIYSCKDLSNSSEEDSDKSLYSFNAFINLKSSRSGLETLDIEGEKDFEILSVNGTEFINGFESLSRVKNKSFNGTFLSKKSLQKNAAWKSCTHLFNTNKSSTKRMERVKRDEKTLKNNLEGEKIGLRKLKRVNTMKKVRLNKALDLNFKTLPFRLFKDLHW